MYYFLSFVTPTNTQTQDPLEGEKGKIVHCTYYTIYNSGGTLFYPETYSHHSISFSFLLHVFFLHQITYTYRNRIKRDNSLMFLFHGKKRKEDDMIQFERQTASFHLVVRNTYPIKFITWYEIKKLQAKKTSLLEPNCK